MDFHEKMVFLFHCFNTKWELILARLLIIPTVIGSLAKKMMVAEVVETACPENTIDGSSRSFDEVRTFLLIMLGLWR